MCVGYDEDGFIKIYNRIRYLVLFDCGGFDKICLSKKSSVKHSFNHNFAKIGIDSYRSLPKYSFKFHPNVCNSSHDLLMMSINLSDIAILNIKGSDYRCIISLISKNEAIKLMKKVDLTKKGQS